MCEPRSEFEDIALDSEPQVLGKSVHGQFKEFPSKTGPKLPTVSVSASSPRELKSPRRAAFLRHAVYTGLKVIGIGSMVLVLMMSILGWPAELVHNEHTRNRVMSMLFFNGLLMVALEDMLEVNKSAVVLLLAATLWAMLAVSYDPSTSEAGAYALHHELDRGLRDVGSVILFLLPAMGVVESIDHFGGFHVVTVAIRSAMAENKERLMPIICILTFLLSSVIDNLTSTIVAVKILRHILPDDDEHRKHLAGLAVIAANAGGAWSPIGDVTTTMLWIQGKITAPKTVLGLFFPSLVSGLFPLVGVYWMNCRGSANKDMENHTDPLSESPYTKHRSSGKSVEVAELEDDSLELEEQALRPELREDSMDEEVTTPRILALLVGVFVILLVPVLKIWVGLPPYLGMLLALGLMWLTSDLLHFQEPPVQDHGSASAEHGKRGVVAALYKVDLSGLLFFTGVLLSVGALDSAGVLHSFAEMLVSNLGQSPVALCTFLGISSAVVDNVPLVEASIDMFKDVPTDDRLWQLVALAAGTGGSILSIGSIAGVTLMSMEGVGFLWYCKRISLWAFLGFIFGIVAYQVQHSITGR